MVWVVTVNGTSLVRPPRHQTFTRDLAGIACQCDACTNDARWEESKHPRGQPDNPGQFASAPSGGAGKQADQGDLPKPHASSPYQKELHAIATGSGSAAEKVQRIRNHPQVKGMPSGFTAKYAKELIGALGGGETKLPPKEAAPPQETKAETPKEAPPKVKLPPPSGKQSQLVTEYSKLDPSPESLNGVAFKKWDAPSSEDKDAWNALADEDKVDEPELPKNVRGAGVIIREPDGRFWLTKPTNMYGGYLHTLPKGTIEKDMSAQATAIKEAFEETGLHVKLVAYAGDFKRTTGSARYYYAERVGGDPAEHGWESEATVLAPPDELFEHLNMPVDKKIAAEHMDATPTKPLQLSDMTKIGKQLGSNPGGKYKDNKTGKQYYVKLSKSPDHAKNELLASKLYEIAGAPILHARQVDMGNGKIGTATEWKDVRLIDADDPEERRFAQKNFATHAWLANWDAAGLEYDNQGIVGGKMTTLDPGGSLIFRAQGAPKGEAFGNKVTEWESLRSPNNAQAHTVYGEMSKKRLQDSASRVVNIPSHVIREMVMEHGPGDEAARKALAEKLIKRRDDIHDKAFPPSKESKGGGETSWLGSKFWAPSHDAVPENDENLQRIAEALEEANQLWESRMYFGTEPLSNSLLEAHAHDALGLDDFVESKHPRDRGGRFARVAGAVGGKLSGAVRGFTHHDTHILRNSLHRANSQPRRHLGYQVAAIGKSLPKLMASHLREEKEHAVHAAGALRAMVNRVPMTPEQKKGLQSFGVRLLMTAGSMAAFGEPTGTVAHLAESIAHEITQHVIGEHAIQLGAAAARVGGGSILNRITRRGQTDAMPELGDLSEADYALLQEFIAHLAKAAQERDISDQDYKRMASDALHIVGDAWEESEHPRGQPTNKGQFAAHNAEAGGKSFLSGLFSKFKSAGGSLANVVSGGTPEFYQPDQIQSAYAGFKTRYGSELYGDVVPKLDEGGKSSDQINEALRSLTPREKALMGKVLVRNQPQMGPQVAQASGISGSGTSIPVGLTLTHTTLPQQVFVYDGGVVGGVKAPNRDPAGTTLHELAHAMDGKQERFSSDPEFRAGVAFGRRVLEKHFPPIAYALKYYIGDDSEAFAELYSYSKRRDDPNCRAFDGFCADPNGRNCIDQCFAQALGAIRKIVGTQP